jgi:plastocyanin
MKNQPAPPVNEVENVVVYLEDNNLKGEEAPGKNRMAAGLQPAVRQLNEMFIPHVLPIIVGTIVQFPNEDPFFHNVFSLSGAKSFDLGRYPKSQTRSVRFDRPGIVKIFCHIHSHMNAVIMVFGHPYFCVPEAKGNFTIDDIPAGRHTLVVWHERLKSYRQVINITPGTRLTLDVVL